MPITYTVQTNLNPEHLNALGEEIARMWTMFALGREAIGGRILENPSGRYANAISFKQTGAATVAIIADEEEAPEARWLEEGHGAYDMKVKFGGRVFPMHRGRPGAYGSLGQQTPVETMKGKKFMWFSTNAGTKSGFARVPTMEEVAENPDLASSWWIPAMPAYSPAGHLADLIRVANQTGNWGALRR